MEGIIARVWAASPPLAQARQCFSPCGVAMVGTGSGRMRRSVTGAATATAPVTTAPFSPLRFTRLMRADESFTRRLQLHGVHEWHDGCVNTISFTEGGDQLISGSDDQQIVLGCWERRHGQAALRQWPLEQRIPGSRWLRVPRYFANFGRSNSLNRQRLMLTAGTAGQDLTPIGWSHDHIVCSGWTGTYSCSIMRTGRFLVLFGAFPHGLPDKVSQHSKQVRRGDLLDGGRTETQLLARHRGACAQACGTLPTRLESCRGNVSAFSCSRQRNANACRNASSAAPRLMRAIRT